MEEQNYSDTLKEKSHKQRAGTREGRVKNS